MQQNIWELDTNIDIILFIDMEMMYMDYWKDKVVERVDAHYHFKNK